MKYLTMGISVTTVSDRGKFLFFFFTPASVKHSSTSVIDNNSTHLECLFYSVLMLASVIQKKKIRCNIFVSIFLLVYEIHLCIKQFFTGLFFY